MGKEEKGKQLNNIAVRSRQAVSQDLLCSNKMFVQYISLVCWVLEIAPMMDVGWGRYEYQNHKINEK